MADLELFLLAVGGDQRVPQSADLFGPVVGGDLDEPLPHRLQGLIAQPGPELVHLGQGHRGVADPDPGPEHGRGQAGAPDRPGRLGHGDQLRGAAGPVGGRPLDHPRGGAGAVGRGDHPAARASARIATRAASTCRDRSSTWRKNGPSSVLPTANIDPARPASEAVAAATALRPASMLQVSLPCIQT